MTNIDRAAELLWLPEPHLSTSECDDQARELAQDLAESGLLMPDLPEPAEKDGLIYFGDDGKTYAFPDRRVVVLHGEWWSYATAEELRTHAYALLAAADYAERNQA